MKFIYTTITALLFATNLMAECPAGCVAANVIIPTPPPVSVINIPANADLAPIFSALKANTTYILAPKAYYKVTGTFVVTAANVSINLNGSSLEMSPAPKSSSSFAVRAANLEIFNGHITKAFGFIHSWAPGFHLHDMKFDNIQYAVPPGSPVGTKATWSKGVNQVYTSDNNLAVHNTLENLDVGYTGTVSIYNTADDFTLKNSTLRGSYGEYCFRSEITSDAAMHHPNNTLLDHITCDNHINGYGKSCIGIRMGGTGLVIQNSSIDGTDKTGYINIAQANGINVVNVGSITLRNNKFLAPRVPQLEIDNGAASVIVDGNTFNTWANTPNVAIASYSNAVFTNNIRLMIPTGTVPLKAFVSSNTIPKGIFVESGTINK